MDQSDIEKYDIEKESETDSYKSWLEYFKSDDKDSFEWKDDHWEKKSTWKTGMAERSGDPELDELIEGFLTEIRAGYEDDVADPNRYDGTFNSQAKSFEEWLSEPGICGEMASWFHDYLDRSGLPDWTDEGTSFAGSFYNTELRNPNPDVHPWTGFSLNGPSDFGYNDRTIQGFDDHEATLLRNRDGRIYSVDWASGQYGYSEIPMVQRLNDQQGWDRQWTSHEIPFERLAAFVLQANWNDIMAKAKAIVQEGRCTIIQNTPKHIMAHVVGDDHDGQRNTYSVEIAREDPTSNVLTQTVCDCQWQQYRWDRTRKFKKLEGRPCKHILATYWKSKATPIDAQDEASDYKTPVGQKGPASPPGQQTIPIPHEFKEEPLVAEQKPQELPDNKDLASPAMPNNPFAPPTPAPPQRQQLQLFDITPGIIPGQPVTPPAPAVSIPGGTPPNPANPILIPGTFSNWRMAGEEPTWLHGDEGMWGQLSFLMIDGQPIMGEVGEHHGDVWNRYQGYDLSPDYTHNWGDFKQIPQGFVNYRINPTTNEILEMNVLTGYLTADPIGPQADLIKQQAQAALQRYMQQMGPMQKPDLDSGSDDVGYNKWNIDKYKWGSWYQAGSEKESNWATKEIPVVSIKLADFFITADDELTTYLTQMRDAGQPMYVALVKPVSLEQKGGKIPMPGALPYDVSSEGTQMYKMNELGYNPQTGQRENADVNEVGGAPEWTGQFAQAPANRRAEVYDFDPDLQWAYINIPLNYPNGEDARLHPHSLAGWVSFNDIRPLPDIPRTPFRPR